MKYICRYADSIIASPRFREISKPVTIFVLRFDIGRYIKYFICICSRKYLNIYHRKFLRVHIVYVIFKHVIIHENGCLFYSISRISKIYFSLKTMNVIERTWRTISNTNFWDIQLERVIFKRR